MPNLCAVTQNTPMQGRIDAVVTEQSGGEGFTDFFNRIAGIGLTDGTQTATTKAVGQNVSGNHFPAEFTENPQNGIDKDVIVVNPRVDIAQEELVNLFAQLLGQEDNDGFLCALAAGLAQIQGDETTPIPIDMDTLESLAKEIAAMGQDDETLAVSLAPLMALYMNDPTFEQPVNTAKTTPAAVDAIPPTTDPALAEPTRANTAVDVPMEQNPRQNPLSQPQNDAEPPKPVQTDGHLPLRPAQNDNGLPIRNDNQGTARANTSAGGEPTRPAVQEAAQPAANPSADAAIPREAPAASSAAAATETAVNEPLPTPQGPMQQATEPAADRTVPSTGGPRQNPALDMPYDTLRITRNTAQTTPELPVETAEPQPVAPRAQDPAQSQDAPQTRETAQNQSPRQTAPIHGDANGSNASITANPEPAADNEPNTGVPAANRTDTQRESDIRPETANHSRPPTGEPAPPTLQPLQTREQPMENNPTAQTAAPGDDTTQTAQTEPAENHGAAPRPVNGVQPKTDSQTPRTAPSEPSEEVIQTPEAKQPQGDAPNGEGDQPSHRNPYARAFGHPSARPAHKAPAQYTESAIGQNPRSKGEQAFSLQRNGEIKLQSQANGGNGQPLYAQPFTDQSPVTPLQEGPVAKMMSQSVVDQITDSAALKTLTDGTKLEIQLNPKMLGKISLELISQNGELTAKLRADSDATRAILGNHLDALKEQMKTAGIHMQNIEISEGKTNADQGGQRNDFQQQWQGRGFQQNQGDRRQYPSANNESAAPADRSANAAVNDGKTMSIEGTLYRRGRVAAAYGGHNFGYDYRA